MLFMVLLDQLLHMVHYLVQHQLKLNQQLVCLLHITFHSELLEQDINYLIQKEHLLPYLLKQPLNVCRDQ
jgi:hypothetical protein